jgi:hypothetical protein
VQPNARDVATVFCAVAGAAFDAVVVKGSGEGRSNGGFESGSSLFGTSAGSGQGLAPRTNALQPGNPTGAYLASSSARHRSISELVILARCCAQ